MNHVLQGIDVAIQREFRELNGRKVAILCNQASLAKDGSHTLDRLIEASLKTGFEIVCAMGPQHGIWGHTQDNMIEWEGYVDSRTGLRFYSLYGETREPRREWLEDVDELIIDIVDVGSRYYTFIWSLANCMKVCGRMGIRVRVLDRVNPISGARIEGTVNAPGYSSFVGLYPLPMRHGLTAGEIATRLAKTEFSNVDLVVDRVEGWDPKAYIDETDVFWSPPSPNMPTADTAVVYPGGCLIEGTKLSEGRGTTRPFEQVGAPYIDAWTYTRELNELKLPGVFFRPVVFQPTFQKYSGALCGGAFVHVSNRNAFEPVMTYVALMWMARHLYGEAFAWQDPPYEYELEKLPFDILAGNVWLREAIDFGTPLTEIRERMQQESMAFSARNEPHLLYERT